LTRALVVIAVLGAAVAAAPAPARAAGGGFPFCWDASRAYPFPYAGPGYRTERFVNRTPDCRQASRETLDFTPDQGFTAYTSISASNIQLRAPHGEAPGAPHTWPLRDSLGHVFALLTQQRLPNAMRPGLGHSPLERLGRPETSGFHDRWSLSYPNGLVYGSVDDPGTRLLIQGQACMTNPRMERENAMVVLFGGRYGRGPFAFGTQLYPGPVYMGIRGFLPLRALPPTGLANPHGRLRGRSTRQLVAYFPTGCNQVDSTSFPPPPSPEPKIHSSLVPLFDWNDRYSGQGGSGDLGSELANYHGWPDPAQERPGRPGPVPAKASGRPDIVREVKLMQSTTGIEGGGIVRAIVPANSKFVELDHFAYRDPNVLCTRVAPGRVEAASVVQWMYVRIVGTSIEGWVPFRAKPEVTKCPSSSTGKPPPR
jgi:hypothetical protein